VNSKLKGGGGGFSSYCFKDQRKLAPENDENLRNSETIFKNKKVQMNPVLRGIHSAHQSQVLKADNCGKL